MILTTTKTIKRKTDYPVQKKIMLIIGKIILLLSDFINLTQVHNFTVSAQDIFTFRRLSVFTVS